MAEVVKAKKQKELVKIEEKETTKSNKKNKKEEPKNKNKKIDKKIEEKNSLWTKFMIYCHGVKNEAVKVRWTTKKDMVKYSIATIVFIIFCSLFFYGIDTIFALIQSLFK